METIIKNIGLVLMIMVTLFSLDSCSDDSDRQPEITSVRLVDADKADSTFVEAERGTMIVVEGHNIDGVLNAYINSQEVGFNTCYNTSTHFIITIPSELKLTAEDSNLKNEIMLVTSHGTATYAFYVLGPEPTLEYFTAEYEQDASGHKRIMPHQEVVLVGSNFYDVDSVYLSSSNPYADTNATTTAESDTNETWKYNITSFSVGDNFSTLTVTMPDVVPDDGYFVVVCHAGGASLKYKATPDEPTISDVSSEMPIPGERVTVYGKNFVFVRQVIIGDREIIIPEEDITVSEQQDYLSFVLPSLPTNSRLLTVVTDGGNASIGFYDNRYLITDFDTRPGSFAWGGYHVTDEDALYPPEHTSGHFHGIEGEPGAWNWWFGQLVFSGFELPDVVPDDTPVSNVELRFECYLGSPIDEAKMKIWLSENEATCLDGIQVTDRISGTTETGRWMTVAYPLSNFTTVATYGEYRNSFNGAWAHIVWNPSDIATTEIRMYVDNYRIAIKN